MGRSLALATVVAGGLVVTSATASYAAPAEAGWICGSITGATVCFEPDGDDFHVRDTAQDSASARADWTVNYSRETPHCVNNNGYDTWAECKFDMKEGYTVCFRPQVYDYSADRLIRTATEAICTVI
ncbi:hypothetical protein [Streptomyces subrutilus]|uniref:hypothetical protein n=1 Tax=Streptomyces subrutilus TaxID=36818 RepID=UPI0033C84F88